MYIGFVGVAGKTDKHELEILAEKRAMPTIGGDPPRKMSLLVFLGVIVNR